MEGIDKKRIAILGLGLMGGSLAMALHGKCVGLMGIDPDPRVLDLARQNGIIDSASSRPEDLLPQADLIVLAAPVRTIITLVGELPWLHPGRAVVMDLGSTKAEIMAAMESLPDRFDPLGGHPMCGKEHASFDHAEASLYRGAPFALTPMPRTSRSAQTLAEELVLTVGAMPFWIDAQTHDRWVAFTSHLPYLVASALASTTPLEAAPLVGPGFRSTSRLAGSSLDMMLDILETNRLNILEGLQGLRGRLEMIESLLASGDELGLQVLLGEGLKNYRELIQTKTS
jgi:prephenate dehydrogenase